MTGNPTLPAGGLQGLKPPITVVRRESDNKSVSSDEYLPSVMTCVNYLKLPPYSSARLLGAKLRTAIREGQEAEIACKKLFGFSTMWLFILFALILVERALGLPLFAPVV